MEIIVQGRGNEYFAPDQVVLSLHFVTKGETYEEVLNKGTENVQLFVEEILLKNGFKKEDMKTRSFVIKQETKYNEVTRTYDPDGYSYNQMVFLKFDYDKYFIANMLEDLSKFDMASMYHMNFGLKDEKECRRIVLSKAYQDALDQAYAIAMAANKTLKYCQKVDFKPFTTDYVSQAVLDSNMLYAEKAYSGATQAIVDTFYPEDIEISETLYCLWIAE